MVFMSDSSSIWIEHPPATREACEFEAHLSHLKTCAKSNCCNFTLNKKYCSVNCSIVENNKSRTGVQRKERHKCLNCNNPTLNKYCSRSCAATINGHLYPKRRETVKTVISVCKLCNIPLRRSINEFCSHKCVVEYKYLLAINDWLAGKISGSIQKNGEISSTIRKWVHRQKGDICWDCGWNEINPATGNVPVQIEHIDGNYSNNRPENLKLLCPNCHALTSTWGSLNNGNGRKYRYAK
jgi:hypothetical protein